MKVVKLNKEQQLSLFQEFLAKDWFKLDVWEDQELEWPGDAVVERMRHEVEVFMAYIIERVEHDSSTIFEDIQSYFDEWDTEDFENDHVELIVGVLYEPMVIAGIDIDEIII